MGTLLRVALLLLLPVLQPRKWHWGKCARPKTKTSRLVPRNDTLGMKETVRRRNSGSGARIRTGLLV